MMKMINKKEDFAVKAINKKENIFNDNIAYIEQYDFSRANLSEENRIHAISGVASICYQNPKALGSESLYNRLMAESMGLPSSSFEFVPVLISEEEAFNLAGKIGMKTGNPSPNILKFGEFIGNDFDYLLTNLRALIDDIGYEDSKKYFNTAEECEIIKEHFKVFLYKVDFPTRSQMVRHRVNWQELSRRYVSGKRVPFDFYISEKMKDIKSKQYADTISGPEEYFIVNTEEVIDICIEHYYKALENGVKPQEARRIIPQAAYTQIWGAFQPTQYENFMKLRDDEVHAQWEIAQVAKAMKELTNEN